MIAEWLMNLIQMLCKTVIIHSRGEPAKRIRATRLCVRQLTRLAIEIRKTEEEKVYLYNLKTRLKPIVLGFPN